MHQETRRHRRRHHLIFYLPVNDAGSGERLGFLGDITTEGLMVISKGELPTGTVYDLEVVDNIDGEQANSVPLRARAVWCHTDVNPDYHATGFELLDVDETAQAGIERLIARVGFSDT